MTVGPSILDLFVLSFAGGLVIHDYMGVVREQIKKIENKCFKSNS